MVDGARPAPQPAPLLGQHTHEILCGELKLSANDVAVLAQEKVI
jgi:crotonobetainyl-CoA:carnitine CoA-transferase CaiB-like acyl-CoA transferase